ncbi:hypothetical protein ABZT45_34780 [Streptomyces sp. NPDC005356]|uniref:hypothetical protein n=1 Tax=Streptomyces sp. NPDC005356 TaxID=3157167 RepID=UPI0033B8B063
MPGDRRSQRQRAVSELRAQGRYGPELRDVLPGFVGLGLAVLAPVVLLIWLHRELGRPGLVLGVAFLSAATAVGLRWRRQILRRRGGHYTPAELDRLSDGGLVKAAARMLGRDGWHVTDLSEPGAPRLYARDRKGREVDVAFRPAPTDTDEDAPEGAGSPAPLREVGRPGIDGLIRLVVHRGAYSRTDILWASRQGGVHLLDGAQLQRWAQGSTLDELGLPSAG